MATSARLEELKKKFDENPRRYFAPLANEYRKQGDLTQAITLCRAHLPNQPGHISGHIVLAQALFEARELPESRQIFEQALELDPENLIALRTLGDIANSQGDVLGARSWYERVLEADPRNNEIAGLLRDVAVRAKATAELPVIPAEVAELEVTAVSFSSVAEERSTETVEAPLSAWDQDKTPIANIAVGGQAASTLSDVPEPEFPGDSSHIFGDGVVDQGAELLGSTAPHVGLDQEFQVLSEEAPVEAQASPDHSEVDGGALELVFGAAAEGVAEETAEVAWGALPESHESVSELRASESHGFELSVGSIGAEVSAVEDAPSGSEQVDAAAERLGGSEDIGDDVQASSEFELAQFEEDSNAFTVAQHLSDPEAHPVQYSDDWFNAPTPPRGVVQVAEPEVPTVASLPQETIVVPTPAKGAEAQSTTVELDTFDLVEGGRAGSVASAQSEDATDFASDPHGDDDTVREHPAAWFYEPRQPEVSAAESNQNDGSPGTLPATPLFDADGTLEPESAPETAFEIALPAEPELAPLYEFASDSAESSAAGVESPSEGIREELALPPNVELEAEPEPVAIDRGPVGMPEVTESESAAVAASELADPTLGRVLQEENTPESAMPEMFVTETMAELYLQQGFVEEALQVYRKLLEWSPGDEAIRSRIAALEAGAPSSIAEAASAAHALDRAGQSVRHFFGRIARRSPSPRAQRESALDLVSLGAQMASRHDSSDAPGDKSVSPTLTELFANAKRPGDDDDAAAQQLASAFSPPETAGRPSRAADSELSLDHLFRDVPRESSGAVTLDAFFAASGGDTSEASDAADDAADEARTGDIEQFTAWLEGLKKK